MLMHTRGILVMTPDERDGPDRQAGARLLGRRSRPRTTSASAATSGSWAPTARRSTGRPTSPAPAGSCSATTSTPTWRRASASRAARDLRPDRARRARRAAPRARIGPARVGEIFSDETNPERKKPFDIRSVMRAAIDADHPPLERWAGMRERRGRGGLGRPSGRLAGHAARHRVAAAAAPRRAPGRRARAVDLGHAVPALGQEGRPRDQRRQRPPPGRRARQPRRLRRLAGVDARVAARVRRRDRARGRQLRRADRLLRRLALPRRRVRRVLPAAQRRARGRGARGRARLGDRRRARRRRSCSPARSSRPRAATRGSSSSTSASRRPRVPSASGCAPSAPSAWDAVLAEKLGEFAAEFDAVHSVERARARWARCSRIVAPGDPAAVPDRRRRARHAATLQDRSGAADGHAGWLTRSLADVPADDALAQRRASATCSPGLRFEKRRRDWRLGRFTAKAAVAAWLGVEPGRVEVLAAATGGAAGSRRRSARARLAVAQSPRAGGRIAVVGAPGRRRLRSRAGRAAQRGLRRRMACAGRAGARRAMPAADRATCSPTSSGRRRRPPRRRRAGGCG